MSQLSDQTHQQITALSDEGNSLANSGQFELAKKKFFEALTLVPEPHTDWKAATWLYTALGDMHFHLRNYEKVMKCFTNAVQCPEGLGNPFVHLRLGQAFLEIGNPEKAADELTRAYMGAGLDIFLEDDPKYIEFLESKIKL